MSSLEIDTKKMAKTTYWGLLIFTALAFFFVLFSGWYSLAKEKWANTEEGYSHGFIILILSVFLIIRALRFINYNQVKPAYWIVPFQLLASLLFILSVHSNIQSIQWFLLPVLILLFFIVLFGISEARRLFFPVLFLYFAIPVWGFLNVYLQSLAVYVNTYLLAMISIPVYIHGLYVTLPAGTFEVAAGCSGLGVFLMFLCFSSLYGYLYYSLWRTRIILVIIAILLALITNWIRIFVIIYVGHTTNMQSSLITEGHGTFGWLLFAGMLVPFFIIAYHLPIWLFDKMPNDQQGASSEIQIKFKPYIIAFISTFTLPLVIYPVDLHHIPQMHNYSIGKILDKSPWINPVYLGADIDFNQVINFNESEIQISIRSYGFQEQGVKELISFNNSLYPSSWKSSRFWLSEGYKYEIVENQQKHILIVYQYSVGGIKTSSRIWAKLYEMLKPILTKQSSSLYLFSMVCAEKTCSKEKAILRDFINMNSAYFEAH